MRRVARVDINQNAIVAQLRRLGVSVCDLSSVGSGCPDLLIGFRQVNRLFEIKNPDQYWELTDDQKIFHATWSGKIEVVESIDEALKILGLIK